jgi:predicted nucleotidyltransferase
MDIQAPMQPILQQNLVAIQALCKTHHVLSLHAFGSVLRQDFGPRSDVDFLVVFDRSHGQSAFAQFFDFSEALEALLGRKVDLISARSIHNPFFQHEIDETKHSIYAA